MTDNNKQSRENKSIKKWLLNGAIIIFIILISYFIFTTPTLTSFNGGAGALNTNANNNFSSWGNLFLILVGITLLLLCYLAVTKRFNKIYLKIIGVQELFKSSERIKYLVIALFTVVGLILLFIGLFYNCCGWWAILINELQDRLSKPDEPLNLRNILIGLAGAITLFLTGFRTYIADKQKDIQIRQTDIEAGRRLSERFDGAVAALSKELNENSFPSHLGGISSLSDLATDSPEHTQRCLDIICSCNQWMQEYIDEFVEKRSKKPYSSWLLKEDNRIANKKNEGKITLLHEKRSQQALAAVSHILEKISTNNPNQLQRLDFHNKILCGINLSNLKLEGINFNNTYLVAASMNNVSLKKAPLNYANLQGAYLDGSHLERALLIGAHLEAAHLWVTHLENSNLEDAHLGGAYLGGAYLKDAYLKNTHLEGAYLGNAHLEDAYLGGAHLEGANLVYANLARASLAGTSLQGSYLGYVNLSYALLLDCNLYGAELMHIKSKNIIFNDAVKIGYIKDEEERKKWLDGICRYMKKNNVIIFTEQMKKSWKLMEEKEEPKEFEILKINPIFTKDDRGVYDISPKYLDDLEDIWQKLVNEKGRGFLIKMSGALSSLIKPPRIYRDQGDEPFNRDTLTNRNVNLINKLYPRVQKLIDDSITQNNK